MEEKVKYRHEMKYLISASQIAILRNRLDNFLPRDPHAGKNGLYNIRSLYFDDYYNRCYFENENGTDPREKFRIRIYDGSDERISLELKRKERGKTLKTVCLLEKVQAQLLVEGKVVSDGQGMTALIQKLNSEIVCSKMHPVVITDYDRMPYVCKNGNVRITFDMNISSSSAVDLFFEKKIPKRPVMPSGMHLLEVKYDEYLPDVIYRVLQLDNLQQTAYSKYYLCRKIGMGYYGGKVK